MEKIDVPTNIFLFINLLLNSRTTRIVANFTTLYNCPRSFKVILCGHFGENDK